MRFCSRLPRTALSEKKTVLKPKSPEKSRPEDTDKSPAKKPEGEPFLLLYTCSNMCCVCVDCVLNNLYLYMHLSKDHDRLN